MNGELVTKETSQSMPVTQQSAPNAFMLPAKLLELAVTNNANVDALEKLLLLQEKYMKEEARKAFFRDMADLQNVLPVITKKRSADFGNSRSSGNSAAKYKYASLDDIAEAIKPYLVKFGFSYRFEQEIDAANMIMVSCVITHKDGHSESNSLRGFADNSGGKNAVQAMSSTVTYLRRYTLTGGFGIATADEDLDGRLPEESKELRDSQRKDAGAINFYTDEKFTANFPNWARYIQAGKKTKEGIIAMVEAKQPMTDYQKQQIMDLEIKTETTQG